MWGFLIAENILPLTEDRKIGGVGGERRGRKEKKKREVLIKAVAQILT